MRWTGSTPRAPGFRSAALFLAVLLCAALPSAAADDAGELLEGELPDWIASIGFGIGIQARPIDGTIGKGSRRFSDTVSVPIGFQDTPFAPLPAPFNMIPLDSFRLNQLSSAYVKTDVDPVQQTSQPGRCFVPRVSNAGVFGAPIASLNGFCAFDTQDSRTLDGASLPISLQILGPPAPIPTRPRLFVQGTYGFEFTRRTTSSVGIKPGDFDAGNLGPEPDIRLELEGEPKSVWFAGGGIALQMPTERPFFLKLGAHYSEDTVDLLASLDRGISINNEVIVRRAATKETFTVKGIGGSVGVETEVVRLGPVGVNFSLDLFFTFPTSETEARLSVDQGSIAASGEITCPPGSLNSLTPGGVGCLAPIEFTWGADEIHYFGAAMLRFTWLGL